MKKLFAFIILMVITGVAVAIPYVIDQAPYRHVYDECLLCGRTRETIDRWNKERVQRIHTSDAAEWFQQFISKEHEHRWITGSVECRENWFGSEMAACGGYGVITNLHYCNRKVKEADLKLVRDEYLKIAKTASPIEIHEFQNEFISPLIKQAQGLPDDGERDCKIGPPPN